LGGLFCIPKRLKSAIGLIACLLLALGFSACGGSSGSSGTSNPPSFSISVGPKNLSLSQGHSGTVNISVIESGFNQSISVSITGLPTGVTSVPASPFNVGSSSQAVTLIASTTAQVGTSTLTFEASGGGLNSSAQASLSITQGPPGQPNDRTSFIRTDDTPLAIVYDAAHQQLFASALHLNCVDVISLVTQQVVQCVPVSGALGLSLSNDGTKVLVGTQVGTVAWIDTTSLQIVERDVIPQIPQGGTVGPGMTYVWPGQAFQTANGKVLLFSNWGYTDLYGDRGAFQSSTLVEWDPVAGTSTLHTEPGIGGVVSVSSDHSKILIAGGGSLSVYDSNTDAITQGPSDASLQFAAMNSAGTQLAVVGGLPLVRFYDSSFAEVGSTAISSCCFAGGGVPIATYSSDGKHFYVNYVAQPNGVPILATIDTATFQIVGEAPGYVSQIAYISAPAIHGYPQAADPSGLVFELADHGVAINDASDFRDFTNAQGIGDFIVATPSEGPVNQGTNIQFTTATFPSLPDVFFGSQTAANPYLFNGAGQLAATAPASPIVGPVNVKAVEANGAMAFMPQAFSYGSLPIQYGSLAAAPQGGVLADLFGYGYSIDIPGADIQAFIGGTQADIQAKHLFPSESGYPFPLQHLVVNVPSGTPGEQDIKVTSPTGTAVSSGAFHYLKSVTDYSSPDTFLYILYDATRNQLYLSAGDHIDVFSLTTQSFGLPISIPSIGGTRLILGLALTPDGTRLLATNESDFSVAIVNPDNPTSGAVAVPLPLTHGANNPGPFQVAPTSTNHAFVTATTGNEFSGGSTPLCDIDLSTLQVSTVTLPSSSNLGLPPNYIHASTDGTTVAIATSDNSGGQLLSWKAVSNTWQLRNLEGQFWMNSAVSGDGSVLATSSDPAISGFPFPYLLDSNLNLIAQVNFPEFQSEQEVYLQLDLTGTLLFATDPLGVDVFDATTGQLTERVLLAEQLASGGSAISQIVSQAIAITPVGDQVFLLTTAGLTVIDLDMVPLAIGRVSPTAASAGSTLTVRGSGFVNGTSAKINDISAVVSSKDGSTLRIQIPGSVHPGPVQLRLLNPDGSKAVRDSAFSVR
jgi:hypothetical protein